MTGCAGNDNSDAEGGKQGEGAAKWGFVDRSGEMVIEPQFDMVFSFSEGLAPVQVDGKWGYIDRTGEFAVEPRFESEFGFPFPEGLAALKI